MLFEIQKQTIFGKKTFPAEKSIKGIVIILYNRIELHTQKNCSQIQKHNVFVNSFE